MARRKVRRPSATRRSKKTSTRPARRQKARRKAAAKPKARRTAGRRPAARKPARKAAKARPAKRTVSARPARAKRATMKSAAPAAPAKRQARRPASRPSEAAEPRLNRDRRVLPDAERMTGAAAGDDRMSRAARTGRQELREKLTEHTETGPELTGGDIDASWEDAYAVGDEAPGGDNPTPDQDRVDDIGRALGVEYADDEELKGADKITQRDKHRWELDPASSEDWPHDRKRENR